MGHGMRIEAVIVCVDYAGELEQSLLANKDQLDDIVVVTKPTDKATLRLCNEHSVRTVTTNVFHDYGDQFNKGRAVNLGLAHLRHDDWLLHLDADIVLPDCFRTMLDHARLEKDCVYGADRFDCVDKDWVKFNQSRGRGFRHHYLVMLPKLPMGARVIHAELGWCPIGFFQLWHASNKKRYPINQGSAEHTDLLFSAQ